METFRFSHAGLELSGGQGRILFVLWKRDRLTVGEIGRETSLAKNTVSAVVDGIVNYNMPSAVCQEKKDRQKTEKERKPDKNTVPILISETVFFTALTAPEAAALWCRREPRLRRRFRRRIWRRKSEGFHARILNFKGIIKLFYDSRSAQALHRSAGSQKSAPAAV